MKVILSTVPKLNVCVKTVTYIQENTLDGQLLLCAAAAALIFHIHNKTADPGEKPSKNVSYRNI